jgi:hypothetical protein
MKSMVGGDPKNGYPVEGLWIHEGEDNLDRNVFDDAHIGTEYGD